MHGDVVVCDGDQRLNAVFMAFFKHTAVKRQPFPVGLCIVAVGVDAAPRNGKAQGLKAHLCKQGNILFVMVVKIHRILRRVIVLCIRGQHRQLALDHRHAVFAVWQDICVGKAPPALVPAAFALVGRHCAAPQKIFRK